MNTLFEILQVVLPSIITGLFTFLITKYTYNKNVPLEKMEIAYNRIYYPIYKIVSNENTNINDVISKIQIYFIKYNKYIDRATNRLFNELCKCTNEAKKKSIYARFKNNIYNRNSYLRRRLGYLEPGFAQLYKYSIPTTKSFFRITMEFGVLYIAIMLCGITMNFSNLIFNISAIVFTASLLCIICELIWCFSRFLYYKIKK